MNDANEVVTNWEQIKKAEKDDQSLVAGVTPGLPSLIAAQKLFRKGASIGLEPDLDCADAVRAAGSAADPADVEAMLGAALAAVVAIGREHDIDAESALASWTRRYKDRFRRMEAARRPTAVSTSRPRPRRPCASCGRRPTREHVRTPRGAACVGDALARDRRRLRCRAAAPARVSDGVDGRRRAVAPRVGRGDHAGPARRRPRRSRVLRRHGAADLGRVERRRRPTRRRPTVSPPTARCSNASKPSLDDAARRAVLVRPADRSISKACIDLRLNEHVLHTWDVEVVLDPNATVPARRPPRS